MEKPDLEERERGDAVPPLGLVPTLAIFIAWSVVLYLATRPGMTFLIETCGLRADISWFVAGGAVFVGLFVTALSTLRYERERNFWIAIKDRCRFRRLDQQGVALTVGACVVVLILTGVIHSALSYLFPGFSPHPPFLKMDPLIPGERWVLLAWIPMFVFNIFGEELFWHGCLLPRNERSFGRWAWIVNGFGWFLFHIPFGCWILVIASPIIFIETWAIQRSKNTWVGVIIHAVINGPAFIFIALWG
ncbi:MAG: CPBP family intramembrane metalloprotease [Deltaproteobacteria bacterium]|nr:MAG: CPBP family intramembrane metalloprotease [Deltaproteobacteria bacterium]